MLEVRQKTIILLFDLCDSYLVELAQSKKCELCSRTICQTLNLGYLLQGLSKMEVWPEKPLEVYLKSKTVLDLQQSLLNISFPETPQTPSPGYYGKSCIGILKRDFANRVTQICQSATLVLPHHREKLTERNRRLKIFSDEIATN
jgi:hypothetical protein